MTKADGTIATAPHDHANPVFGGRDVYENVNPKIAELYDGERLVLDIGCGSGALAEWIKRANPGAVVHGIDISPEAGQLAAARLDQFWCLDLDRDHLPDSETSYDLIILGDVLEHLKRPDLFLAGLRNRLRPGGGVIASVPNVANYSIRLRLLLGEFRYAETGILDRSHLRFFTRQSLAELIGQSGFAVVQERVISRFPGFLAALLPGLLAVQFIVKLRIR